MKVVENCQSGVEFHVQEWQELLVTHLEPWWLKRDSQHKQKQNFACKDQLIYGMKSFFLSVDQFLFTPCQCSLVQHSLIPCGSPCALCVWWRWWEKGCSEHFTAPSKRISPHACSIQALTTKLQGKMRSIAVTDAEASAGSM